MFFDNLKKNIYSQNGEDGIIEYLLDKIEDKDYWCCEFGAWDGKHLSNTFNLVSNRNYNAVYIEGDESKYQDLLNTCIKYNKIVPIKSWVGIEGESSLDNILSSTEIPKNFDLLSIDVDGTDYLIWKHFLNYSPKIVVIEINSSFRPELTFNDEELNYNNMLSRSGKDNGGVNFKTCYDLGRTKGYRLFTHTGNLIFIHEKYSHLFPDLATDDNYFKYFLSGWLPTTGYETKINIG